MVPQLGGKIASLIHLPTMREWLVVDPGAAEHWRPLTAEAFAYVDDITP